jgi:membrane-bound metal-dependent hydrolase YbcI (DUF457 family)
MIKKHMPSPLGHALAGVAAAWAADLIPGRRVWRRAIPPAPVFTGGVGAGSVLTLTAAALGTAPDLDLFLAQHRAITHSLGAAAVVFIVAAIVTGQVTKRAQRSQGQEQSGELQSKNSGTAHVLRVAAVCAAAYASHLLLDWLAIDRRAPYGLQMWWPLSDGWYISGLDIFPQTERRNLLSLATLSINLKAMAFETAVMLPVLGLVWLVHEKTVTGFSTEPARRHQLP